MLHESNVFHLSIHSYCQHFT